MQKHQGQRPWPTIRFQSESFTFRETKEPFGTDLRQTSSPPLRVAIEEEHNILQNIAARRLFRMLWHTATKQQIRQPSPSQSWSTSATGKKKEQTMTNKTIVAMSISLGLLLLPISFPSFLFISYNLHKHHRVSSQSFRFGSPYFPRCCKGVVSPLSPPNGDFFRRYGRTDGGCPCTH